MADRLPAKRIDHHPVFAGVKNFREDGIDKIEQGGNIRLPLTGTSGYG
jgi:hypothetical protein